LLKYQSDIERATKELLGRSRPVAYLLGDFIGRTARAAGIPGYR